MHGRKNSGEKFYPTYKPYPVSWDVQRGLYSEEPPNEPQTPPFRPTKKDPFEDFPDLAGDASSPDLSPPKPVISNEEQAFRPLRILQSLFADRLDFLQRALDELETSKDERQVLTRYALEDLDSEIRECDRSLGVLLCETALDNPDERHHLERRLLDLKRERRREALLSWRDLVWLKGEIRKLQREIDSLGRTARSAQNGETQR